MSVKLGTSSSGSLGQEIAPGVYGKEGKIVKVTQFTDKVLGTFEPDLFITFEIDTGGEYNDTIDIFGSFKRDERTSEVIDWGGAFRIDKTLKELGAYDGIPESKQVLSDNLTIPDQAIDNLYGIDVLYLLFAVGKNPNKDKNMWNTFPSIALKGKEPEDCTRIFNGLYQELKTDDYNYTKLVKGRDYMETQSRSGKTQPSSETGSKNPDDFNNLPF